MSELGNKYLAGGGSGPTVSRPRLAQSSLICMLDMAEIDQIKIDSSIRRDFEHYLKKRYTHHEIKDHRKRNSTVPKTLSY